MFWAASLFKIVDADKSSENYWLDINTYFTIRNIELIQKSNYYYQIKKLINDFEYLSYDKKIDALREAGEIIKKQTLKNIKNGKFKLLKYSYEYDLFYISFNNFNTLFKIGNYGEIIIKKNNDHFEENHFISEDLGPSFGDKTLTRRIRSKIKIKSITNIQQLDINSGLGIVATALTDNSRVGLIYDAGEMNGSRTQIAEKIFKYFKDNDLKGLIMIISHDHYDHYNVFNLKIFSDWVSKLDTSYAIYYKDIELLSKVKSIANFKIKYPLERKNVIVNFGSAQIRTFMHVLPIKFKDQNESSMLLKIDNVVFTGDQEYKNIPSDWKTNLEIFQVPHHGSKLSGSYTTAFNNKENILPNGKKWSLPDKTVETHFKLSNSIFKKII